MVGFFVRLAIFSHAGVKHCGKKVKEEISIFEKSSFFDGSILMLLPDITEVIIQSRIG